MDTPNNILYQAFSVINLIGCSYALYRLYTHFDKSIILFRALVMYIHFMILCLFIFAVYQLAAIANPTLDLPWQFKLGVTVFWIKSVVFNKVATKISEILAILKNLGIKIGS